MSGGSYVRRGRQMAVRIWIDTVFGEECSKNWVERVMRFAEEAVELVQATGLGRTTLDAIVDRVYSREPGEPTQEIGQVGVTLLALGQCIGVDVDEAERLEFECLEGLDPAKLRARQNAKADKGIGLRVRE